MKISFKPYQNEHNSVMDTGERGKKTCNIDWKISMKILFHYPPTISSNPKILHVKAFLKTFPTKMKPTKCPAREKKWGKKSEKRGEERKWKVKVKTAVSLLNSKTISKFCFLRMPELRKLILYIWIRRPPSVSPVNSSLWHNAVTRKPLE